MLKEIKAQGQELNKSVEAIANIIATQTQPPKDNTIMLSKDLIEMNNLSLPKDLNHWRNLHVLAWIAYKLELPMYMDSFKVNHGIHTYDSPFHSQ